MEIEELRTERLDIVILAGQSNAYGYGLGSVANEYKASPDILMMKDIYPVDYRKNEKNEEFFDYKLPTEYFVEIAHESENSSGKIGNLSLVFADMYRKKFLCPGRKILIIESAVGGTGFAKKQWGVNEPLCLRLDDMIKSSLSLNSCNKLVALLWHQGEHDAYENGQMKFIEKSNFYYNRLKGVVDYLRNKYDTYDLPVISGGFTDEWRNRNIVGCDAIYDAYHRLSEDVEDFTFIETQGLLSNNQMISNGDDIHFSRDALYKLGEKYFEAYNELRQEH